MSRLIELAVRAWPPGDRADNSDELVDTATAMAADGSTLREAAALVRSGMRARFRRATGGRRSRVWESGLRVAVFASFATVLAQIIAALIVGPSSDTSRWDSGLIAGSMWLVVAMLTLALDRPLVGVATLVVGAIAFVWWNPVDARPELAIILGVHVVGLLVTIARGGRADRTFVASVIGLATLAAAAGLVFGNFWLGLAGVPVVMTFVALAVCAFDARLLAAVTCFWLIQFMIMALIAAVQAPERFTEIGMAIPPAVVAAGAAGVTWATRPRPV